MQLIQPAQPKPKPVYVYPAEAVLLTAEIIRFAMVDPGELLLTIAMPTQGNDLFCQEDCRRLSSRGSALRGPTAEIQVALRGARR